MLKGKHIILGITGGIAAYKSVSLLRLFVKAGAEVQVVITPSGKEFITPVTLSALSGKPVISEFFTANTGSWNSHVDLGLWADAGNSVYDWQDGKWHCRQYARHDVFVI